VTDDHRTRPRRRGAALNAAIYQATLDELVEVGYARLTMERVAERAGASKASLYRRWPSRMELVFDAVRHALPDPDRTADTGSLRGDVLAWMRDTATLLAGPTGEALRGLLGDALGDVSRTVDLRQRSHSAGRRAMREIARRAVARGEIDPAAVTPARLDAGPALLRQQFLFHGPAIPDRLIVEIVDEVVVPLLVHRAG
jgi:AcrR family transcriptional regulator